MATSDNKPASQWRVFISHCSKDAALAKRITLDLESRGAKVWIDERDLPPGENWRDRIIETIQQVNYVVVLLSHNALDAVGVRAEIEAALTFKRQGRDVKLIPVLLEEGAIPESLHDFSYIRFSVYDTAILEIARAIPGLSTEATHISDLPPSKAELSLWRNRAIALAIVIIAGGIILTASSGWLGPVIATGVVALVFIKLLWARHIFQYTSKDNRGSRQGRRKARWDHHFCYEYFGSSTGDRRGTAYPFYGASISVLLLLGLCVISVVPAPSATVLVAMIAIMLVAFLFVELTLFPKAVAITGPHLVPFYAAAVIATEVSSLFLLSSSVGDKLPHALSTYPELRIIAWLFPIGSGIACGLGKIATVYYMRNIDNEPAKDALNASILVSGAVTFALGVTIVGKIYAISQ